MNKFRKLGLISYNGKIEVHNSLLNAVLHEKPETERDDSISKSVDEAGHPRLQSNDFPDAQPLHAN
jgi:hypothetical protein